jgi:tetratricopeptide (TPR) repeat protein
MGEKTCSNLECPTWTLMTDASQPYHTLLDEIVAATLKGTIRSEAQVYQWLERDIDPDEQAQFEAVLGDRLESTKQHADDTSDELKQAKAIRSLRALKRLHTEWQRLQTDRQALGAIAAATQAILSAETPLFGWIQVSDPNHANRLTLADLKQLATAIDRLLSLQGDRPDLSQLSAGMRRGLEACQRLDGYLFEWIYASQRQIGFAATPQAVTPWELWASHSHSSLLKQLFQTLAQQQSVSEWARHYPMDAADIVELAISLRNLQQRLVTWFEQQPYDSQWGTQAAISTFLTFAALWAQVAQGMADASAVTPSRKALEHACFQALVQLLRSFSQHVYFPLYGGVFALFSGQYLQDALSYLDAPLRSVKGTQAKARILTLLGCSSRVANLTQRAAEFHQQALEIAQAEADLPCAIANLNHLSRLGIAQKNYAEALRFGQQALVLARQSGDILGKAHALTNVGSAEILAARDAEQLEPEVYETAIDWLQQGLKLSEGVANRQSQALCYNSLGVAYVTLGQLQMAIPYLEKGVQLALQSGDVYLQGVNLAYLAEAYYGLENLEQAIFSACLSLYWLEQIGAIEWRQPAGLLIVLRGKLGEDVFKSEILNQRPQLIRLIGVDGYDYIPQILSKY